jgi:hypothetical protein
MAEDTSGKVEGVSLPELKDQLARTAQDVVSGSTPEGWTLQRASWDTYDYYYDSEDYPIEDGMSAIKKQKPERVRIKMQSKGEIMGGKITFSAVIKDGVARVDTVQVGNDDKNSSVYV